MSLPKVRTWAVLAALTVAVQAPAFAAGQKTDPSNQKRIERQLQGIDRQIDEFRKSGGWAKKQRPRLIIQGDATNAALLAALKKHNVQVRRRSRGSRQLAIELSGDDAKWLKDVQGITGVSLDAPVAAAPLANSEFTQGFNFVATRQGKTSGTQQVSANSLLTADGGTFNGNELRALLGVAIIDSGIAPVADFEGRISAFYDFTNGQGGVPTTPVDGYGHGTHVAGLAAGSGVMSN